MDLINLTLESIHNQRYMNVTSHIYRKRQFSTSTFKTSLILLQCNGTEPLTSKSTLMQKLAYSCIQHFKKISLYLSDVNSRLREHTAALELQEARKTL